MFVCAGNGEEFEFASSIGVGLVQSAINLTRLCLEQNPEFLCFVGSAGSYDGGAELLELCIAKEAVQMESSLLMGGSYTPIVLREKSLENVSHRTIDVIQSLEMRQVVVNSSNYITTDSVMAEMMVKRGILLENMEFFSVLSVARKFNLPAIGVFCVSNYCHLQAHQEFVENRNAVRGKIEGILNPIFIQGLQ